MNKKHQARGRTNHAGNGNQSKFASEMYGVRSKHEVPTAAPKLNTYETENDYYSKFVTKSSSEDDDEHVDPSLGLYGSGYKNSKLKNSGKGLKKNFCSSIDQYKNSKASFSDVYRRWLPMRRNTLEKLRLLHSEVHDKEIGYNKEQASFKELSYNSRMIKSETENEVVDFLASLTQFFGDAVGGLSSIVQAVNVDSYHTRFKEIIDHDAEETRELYTSRSECIVQYQGIEEIMRKFYSGTLALTGDTIADTLQLDKHWMVMKTAYQNDNMPQLLNAVGNFFDNACQSEVITTVGDSLKRYVDDNPAALDACKSTGKVIYGAINNFGKKENENRSSMVGNIKSAANLYMMIEDKNEIDRLKKVISEDTHQSKLESQIEDAITSLESELKEMNNLYSQFVREMKYNDSD